MRFDQQRSPATQAGRDVPGQVPAFDTGPPVVAVTVALHQSLGQAASFVGNEPVPLQCRRAGPG